ncbi:Hok/Gef family protein [Escherichia coli]
MCDAVEINSGLVRYLTRKSLCEIRYRDGHREVAAFMAYESGK